MGLLFGLVLSYALKIAHDRGASILQEGSQCRSLHHWVGKEHLPFRGAFASECLHRILLQVAGDGLKALLLIIGVNYTCYIATELCEFSSIFALFVSALVSGGAFTPVAFHQLHTLDDSLLEPWAIPCLGNATRMY
eukprot:4770013-Amphidinium_carterae.2